MTTITEDQDALIESTKAQAVARNGVIDHLHRICHTVRAECAQAMAQDTRTGKDDIICGGRHTLQHLAALLVTTGVDVRRGPEVAPPDQWLKKFKEEAEVSRKRRF